MLFAAVGAAPWLRGQPSPKPVPTAPEPSVTPLTAHQQLARDIFRELVEINTVTNTGDTARAAEAMAARLRTGGLPAADVQVFKPAPHKGNLVARRTAEKAQLPLL